MAEQTTGYDAPEVGLARAGDVLPDGRVDHRGHLSDNVVGDGTSTCLDCTSDDGDDPWITWTIPYDVDGKPISKDWRNLPYVEVLRLCGMTSVIPSALSESPPVTCCGILQRGDTAACCPCCGRAISSGRSDA